MEIKVLFENSKLHSEFRQRHGLSLFIHDSEKRFLFDTRANKKILHNANCLGESLPDLDGVILSHGHSDHTGGLTYLDLENTPIYAAKGVEAPHYIKILSRFLYVGMPKNGSKNNLCRLTEITEIAPNYYLVPLKKTENITKNLYVKKMKRSSKTILLMK